MQIYLDANATTAVSATARLAVDAVLNEGPHNPSSAHQSGRKARECLKRSRQVIAEALGQPDPENIYFTSGGTEANNIVVRAFADIRGSWLACSSVEYASVLSPVTLALRHVVLAVTADGHLDSRSGLGIISDFPSSCAVLLSLQAANSETGIIQRLGAVIEEIRSTRPDIFIHIDAAQAFGRIPVGVERVDALTSAATSFTLLAELVSFTFQIALEKSFPRSQAAEVGRTAFGRAPRT